MPLHETEKNHVGSGLAMQNHLIDIVGDGTAWASATTLATYQAVNNAKEALATIHETDKPCFQIANRYMATLNAMDIITAADIAAANTTALWRTQFTEDDATFAAGYHGARGR